MTRTTFLPANTCRRNSLPSSTTSWPPAVPNGKLLTPGLKSLSASCSGGSHESPPEMPGFTTSVKMLCSSFSFVGTRTARSSPIVPPNTRPRLSRERLPHTTQVSPALSLMTSQLAHSTAFKMWIVLIGISFLAFNSPTLYACLGTPTRECLLNFPSHGLQCEPASSRCPTKLSRNLKQRPVATINPGG